MTLDISKFIENSLRTQSKIHHFDVNVKATKVADIPQSVSSLITNDYGEKYLNDADYIAFFWGAIGKDQIEKLFNVADKALGKSANKLTDKDFKKISLNSTEGANDAQLEDTSNDDEEEIDVDDEDDDNDDDNEEDVEIDVDDEDDDNDDNDEDFSDDNDDTLNEDDEEIEVEVKEENIPTAYFFLKITAK